MTYRLNPCTKCKKYRYCWDTDRARGMLCSAYEAEKKDRRNGSSTQSTNKNNHLNHNTDGGKNQWKMKMS